MTAEPTTDAELLAARARVPEHVVYRSFPRETVVLNLQTGKYHGLNVAAAAMLTSLDRSDTVGEAAIRLAQHFGRCLDEIQVDLLQLCHDLLDRGLIEFVSSMGS